MNFAQKLVNTIEGTPTAPQAAPPGPSLEEVLLEGSVPERRQRRPSLDAAAAEHAAAPATELDLLRADFDSVLLQRTQLRAQLVAEQERRARAEAELVSLGACWLGTDTQAELQRRAEAERQRSLDAARAELMREAEQRVAKVRAEMVLLQQRLGPEEAPSALALRMELRKALHAELAKERQEARAAVQARCRQPPPRPPPPPQPPSPPSPPSSPITTSLSTCRRSSRRWCARGTGWPTRCAAWRGGTGSRWRRSASRCARPRSSARRASPWPLALASP